MHGTGIKPNSCAALPLLEGVALPMNAKVQPSTL
jgi:hypothetical protein